MSEQVSAPIVFVAGMGRCGSSLVMQMLAAGGIEANGQHPAYEHPSCGVAHVDIAWLRTRGGTAVKLLDPHRTNPPIGTLHHVTIWLDRDFEEQAKSHAKVIGYVLGFWMSKRDRLALEASLREDRARAMKAAGVGSKTSLLMRFEDILRRPVAETNRIAQFLARWNLVLDVERAASVVWRRSPDCYPGLLELELMESARMGGL